VIDLHSHVLPGIDDGPETIESSLALARAAYAAGTRVLVATPHVSWHYPNDAATIARLAGELRSALDAEGIDLELRAGAEIALTRLPELDAPERERLRLGGGPWLLIEPPFAPVLGSIEEMLLELQAGGQRVLLAHPERCAAFHSDPKMLTSLVRAGVLTSLTAGSLVGQFGERVRRFALELMREQLVHNVASDTHDVAKRPPSIADELERAGVPQALAGWLTEEVPAAILSGDEIPPRPAVELARAGWPRRVFRRGATRAL
jgi:protein-tyrosine phosphatase